MTISAPIQLGKEAGSAAHIVTKGNRPDAWHGLEAVASSAQIRLERAPNSAVCMKGDSIGQSSSGSGPLWRKRTAPGSGAHRAAVALRAISERSSGVSLSARARPPLSPPARRPGVRSGAGVFSASPMDSATI